MFFQRKKHKRPLEMLCEDFYEDSILNPSIGEGRVDVLATFAQTHKTLIAEQDARFADIDTKILATETINLRFELFGLAFLHLFGPDTAVKASLFTHDYLLAKERHKIWGDMEAYNQQIYHSTLSLEKKMGASWERYVVLSNKARFELFTKHLDEARRRGVDVEKDNFGTGIARPVNRLFTEKPWKDGTTARFLIIPLCDRLGFDSEFLPNESARMALAAIITGFYNGARDALERVEPT
jgi:hypothetical protein